MIAIRGSISLRDIFTDLTAASDRFDAPGLPPDTMAHRGMAEGAIYVAKRLKQVGIIDKAIALYPDYDLILTGHSLGAGVATLLALKLRPKYPDLKVYAFATPGKQTSDYFFKFLSPSSSNSRWPLLFTCPQPWTLNCVKLNLT